MKNKVAVVGAGAAGMLAAITAAENGAEVTVFEKNPRVGRKLMITGKGRCNVTNNCPARDFIDNVPTNGRFLYSAINAFSPQDTMDFFERNGVGLKTERGNRVFPVSDKAVDIVDCLNNKMLALGCRVINKKVTELKIAGEVKSLVTFDGEYLFDNVIIACGGRSYPQTGSSGDGYAIARAAGHSIAKITPSLVPIESDDKDIKGLRGLSLRNIAVTVKNTETGKTEYSDFGEMLFTHFGVSGPVILSASAHIKDINSKKYILEIDLKPGLAADTLLKRIQRDLDGNSQKDLINSLDGLLPKSIIPVIVSRSGVNPRKKSAAITKEERGALAEAIKGFTVRLCGFRPVEEAIVTSGGVSVKEINPKTMESRLCSGLFFAGEVIDADGYTGGFNLQIAFSTGYLAGVAAAQNVRNSEEII